MPYRVDREKWIERAESLKPVLRKATLETVARCGAEKFAVQRHADFLVKNPDTTDDRHVPGRLFDFTVNTVGHLRLRIATGQPGSHVVLVRLGEIIDEVLSTPAEGGGQLLQTWLSPVQVELRDGEEVTLGERRAFRFVHVEPADESLTLSVITETTLADEIIADQDAWPQWLRDIDRVALQTLRNCAQEVFEDGPKRDRRLWLGDLRLQAISSYTAAPCYDLVKRCLYLLASCADERGMIFACVFEKPKWHRADEWIPDYALLYGATLLDYTLASGDRETAMELWPIAQHQVALLDWSLDANGVYECKPGVWNFVDWHADLDRSAAVHGTAMYGMRKLATLATLLGFDEDAKRLAQRYDSLRVAALSHLYDPDSQLFVSGPNRQISWASQIWMILGGAVGPEDGAALLQRVATHASAIKPVTPYLYHHLVEAQLTCGLADAAMQTLHDYWGEMVRRGATTFWEVFIPDEPTASPYHNYLLNSYCHAWSCTPLYFARNGLAHHLKERSMPTYN